jgi:hypothetical protein
LDRVANARDSCAPAVSFRDARLPALRLFNRLHGEAARCFAALVKFPHRGESGLNVARKPLRIE